MNKLISPTQTAFIKGRQISDGILITSEVYHSLQTEQSKGLILKIDFAKAFDCINWEFLFHVLEVMHFDVKWIKWIRNLFDSSRVSVLVNGSPTEEFHPTRGLRQGDPLSPLLFNIIGEVLSCLIYAAHSNGLFEGVAINGCSDRVTHLQFADDVILFLNNNSLSVKGIKATLQVFELISGLQINYRKSKLYGFKENLELLQSWSDWLGCSISSDPLSYLGAPIGQSPKRTIFWRPLEHKIASKLQRWNASNVSMAGRLVLLQSVLDSSPVYWFSLFKMPQTTIQYIDKQRRHFLWGGKTNGPRKLHLLNWERLCTPKSSGGLGIASLEVRNISLLAKWWWRCYSQRDQLWNTILTRKYGELIRYNLGLIAGSSNLSPILKGIVNLGQNKRVEPLLRPHNFKWELGNGSSIYFWEDWWWGDGPLATCYSRLYSLSKLKFKSIFEFLSLWNETGSDHLLWNLNLLPSDVEQISQLRVLLRDIQPRQHNDKLFWQDHKGSLTSKNLMKCMTLGDRTPHAPSRIWSLIWSLKVPPKIRIFLWKVRWGILPSKQLLHSRLAEVSPCCDKCESIVESQNHILWECKIARWVWDFIANWWSLKSQFLRLTSFSLENILSLHRTSVTSKIWHLIVAASLWTIWLARNESIFQSSVPRKSVLLNLVFTRINKWGEASKLTPFTADPLWKSNPSGAVVIYYSKLSAEYWNYKFLTHDLVCMTDGAWGACENGSLNGAIGGRILNKDKRVLHVFSIPVYVVNSLQAELEALLYMLDQVKRHFSTASQVAICSDSKEALQIIRKREVHCEILRRPIPEFSSLLDSIVSLYYVPRALNSEADDLAKEGLNRATEAIFWAS
ncbi:uncharacterized protein LOC135147087 [Daucus carota subsp. sativus]|uniref:uncharacterized protein LOC135147087 n=1 Tax=Daucus carota subsp. sativus TaxID=79200 RepID=UPI003082902A